MRTAANTQLTGGVAIAAVSAMSFGLSGPLAAALIDGGWSSTAASLLRLGVGALVLVIPALFVGRRRLATISRAPWSVVAYGVVGVAMVQLCFFNAVRHLDVAVALLIEYSAPVLVILYRWLIAHHRPGRTTVTGATVAVAGLLVVIGGGSTGWSVDPIGVAWACAAAVGLAGYFLLAGADDADGEHDGDRRPAVDPLALTCGGLVVGSVLVAIVAATGLFPMTVSTGDVTLAHSALPWWTAALAVAAISTSLAYVTGVAAVRRLGPTLASFVALAEVLTSAVASWALLGQAMSPLQMFGALVMLAGIVVVRRGNGSDAAATDVLATDLAPAGVDGQALRFVGAPAEPQSSCAAAHSDRSISYSTSPRS